MHSPGLGLSGGELFGVQQSNAGGERRVFFTDTLCCIDFEFFVCLLVVSLLLTVFLAMPMLL